MGLSWGCTWDFDRREPGSRPVGVGGIIRKKIEVKWMTEKETSWKCFLTKFFLTPKSQASILLTTWVHPQKRKIPFLFVEKKKKKQFSKVKVVWKNKLV